MRQDERETLKQRFQKRISRNRKLTCEEAAKYEAIRDPVTEELPDLIARHHERMGLFEQWAMSPRYSAALPISTPVRKTSRPPMTTWNTAEAKGVSMNRWRIQAIAA